jgi:hypothetical protein
VSHHDPEVPELCPDCGHVHTGLDLGQICVGCPCLSVPAVVGRRHALTPRDIPPVGNAE